MVPSINQHSCNACMRAWRGNQARSHNATALHHPTNGKKQSDEKADCDGFGALGPSPNYLGHLTNHQARSMN